MSSYQRLPYPNRRQESYPLPAMVAEQVAVVLAVQDAGADVRSNEDLFWWAITR